MPKIIIHSPAGTFDVAAQEGVARELTDFALDCEGLHKSPFVKSKVRIDFNEYPGDAVFMGHEPASAKVISAQTSVIEGALGDEAKRTLIRGATEILGRHSGAEKLRGARARSTVDLPQIAGRRAFRGREVQRLPGGSRRAFVRASRRAATTAELPVDPGRSGRG